MAIDRETFESDQQSDTQVKHLHYYKAWLMVFAWYIAVDDTKHLKFKSSEVKFGLVVPQWSVFRSLEILFGVVSEMGVLPRATNLNY